MPKVGDSYEGSVVFVEGVHYPCDEDGHAVKKLGLRWTQDGYVFAADDEPLHNDVHHEQDLVMVPGSE